MILYFLIHDLLILLFSVFRSLVAKIIDIPMFNPELYKPCPSVTMHQFFSFAHRTDPLTLVMDLAHECKYSSSSFYLQASHFCEAYWLKSILCVIGTLQ